MNDDKRIVLTKKAALEVLKHNMHGDFFDLPRTAGWGYPEPYTRDLLINSFGIIASRDLHLIKSLKKVLVTLAKNQSPLGQIPSLVHLSSEKGATDTTPLFLIALKLYRKFEGIEDFLDEAANRALTWLRFQSPDENGLVSQLPTTDWRDEQWVLGYGLYVNVLNYICLRLYNPEESVQVRKMFNQIDGGFLLPDKPYYATWFYKVYKNKRFDLLGNSLAILAGLPDKNRAKEIILWIEKECQNLRNNSVLAFPLPPNFFPYIQPQDPDWIERYADYNPPGEYHNGGIWPFVCGFYIAALVAAGKLKLAEKHLFSLSEILKLAVKKDVSFGFNEWFKAQNGKPMGNDWQSWSAAMFLYAVTCVEKKKVHFFEDFL
ncbi:amylo-alpha-1,6-glucosidase [Candidatus Riflebacteria bacterium]